MKKKIIIILILIITIIGSGILYLFQEREYFCLTSNNCITVWKTTEGAYIIPGKYTSWFKPKTNCNYIKADNTQFLTLYYTNEIPGKIVVRDQGKEGGIEGRKYEIYNYVNLSPTFVEFSKEYKKILYLPNAVKFNDLKYGVSFLDINIFENYATTSDGRILK
ncbi:hypothetical protein [Apibacter adventoris]|uniref:Uncharacterized protein n=1 Tax=Apibacter adventoris TaxID=1679466 RepID=A0A2S8AEJ4_9FLAO|nr:hypothetical protein [Apibacter adventoris]PQL93773.1 hypothetical protein C4S77_04265 [Apibacter adventoris]